MDNDIFAVTSLKQFVFESREKEKKSALKELCL